MLAVMEVLVHLIMVEMVVMLMVVLVDMVEMVVMVVMAVVEMVVMVGGDAGPRITGTSPSTTSRATSWPGSPGSRASVT